MKDFYVLAVIEMKRLCASFTQICFNGCSELPAYTNPS